MFTRDIKTFKTIYDYLRGLDSLFFLYVFGPLLFFSIAYLRLNNKKTGIVTPKELDYTLIGAICLGIILLIVYAFYVYYKAIKQELNTTVQKEIVIQKEVTKIVTHQDEDDEIHEQEQQFVEEQMIKIKDIRALLIHYRKIAVSFYQKYCLISMIVVSIFAFTNLSFFTYLYGVLVVIISLEKPTFSRVCKKIKLTKLERDYILENNEIPA